MVETETEKLKSLDESFKKKFEHWRDKLGPRKQVSPVTIYFSKHFFECLFWIIWWGFLCKWVFSKTFHWYRRHRGNPNKTCWCFYFRSLKNNFQNKCWNGNNFSANKICHRHLLDQNDSQTFIGYHNMTHSIWLIKIFSATRVNATSLLPSHCSPKNFSWVYFIINPFAHCMLISECSQSLISICRVWLMRISHNSSVWVINLRSQFIILYCLIGARLVF